VVIKHLRAKIEALNTKVKSPKELNGQLMRERIYTTPLSKTEHMSMCEPVPSKKVKP
jgi:hypothetical protein